MRTLRDLGIGLVGAAVFGLLTALFGSVVLGLIVGAIVGLLVLLLARGLEPRRFYRAGDHVLVEDQEYEVEAVRDEGVTVGYNVGTPFFEIRGSRTVPFSAIQLKDGGVRVRLRRLWSGARRH
jgi:hypothetical protein